MPGADLKASQENPARHDVVLCATIVALVIVRVVVARCAGLTDDEAYYRLWALAPAMSHFDHPPMVGWMIAAGRWIAGDTSLGVRLPGILASLLGPFLLWRATHLLFGTQIARRAVWIALAMPILAVGGIIVTPDTPSVLFWGLSAWALAELYASRNANWWLAIGLFAGLGLLSKYSNLFVGASIVVWLILFPSNRSWFRAWQLWAGGLVACGLALPVVLWNAQNGWLSFAKQFGRVQRGSDFTLTYLAEFAGGFLGLASPVIAILAVAGLWIVVRSAISARDQPSALIAAGIVPLLAYFLVHSLHDRVQPNWMAPIYPSFAVCAAIALGRIEDGRHRLFGGLGRSALAIGFLLSGLLYLHAVYPLTQSARLRDPSSQMRGWGELAADLERVRAQTGACWIATSSYATTGQLAYALTGKMPVAQLNERHRYLHLPALDDRVFACPALYVELDRRSALALLHERFRSVSFIETLARSHRGVALAAYPVYLVADPRDKRL